MGKTDDDINDWWGEYEKNLPDTCPNCNEPYDEIDREYQICSKCWYKNYDYKPEEKIPPSTTEN